MFLYQTLARLEVAGALHYANPHAPCIVQLLITCLDMIVIDPPFDPNGHRTERPWTDIRLRTSLRASRPSLPPIEGSCCAPDAPGGQRALPSRSASQRRAGVPCVVAPASSPSPQRCWSTPRRAVGAPGGGLAGRPRDPSAQDVRP